MAFLAPIAVPLAIGSAAIGAVGSIEQGQAQAASAGYNAKIARQNAQLATQNAQWEGAEGEQQYGMAGLKSQSEAGKVKVNQAASGVDVNSGSAVDVQKSQAELGMLNEMNIRSNAARRAYGYNVEASSDIAQANLDRKEASQAKTAGYIGAATSLLGGASSASMYGDFLGSKGLGDTVTTNLYQGFGPNADVVSTGF